MQTFKAPMFLALLLMGPAALASGFEKSIPFGGQTAGVAGIGTPYMQGAQALFFNPAGLVSNTAGAQDVSLNVSPTFPSFKASVDSSGDQVTSRSTVLVPFSLMYGVNLTNNLGLGIGGYVSGGLGEDFQNIPPNNTESKVNIAINEMAVGLGYKIMDGLKIGAAYRVVAIKADINLDEYGQSGTTAQVNNSNLKDTEYTGYKVGAQWAITPKWDLGLVYRSEVDFKAKGDQSIQVVSNGTVAQTINQGVTMGTMLPDSWTLGADYKPTENWTVYGEYVFTEYSKVTNVSVNTDTGTGNGPLQLQFKDEHNVRVAGEYKGWAVPIRFGYIWTSQVTNANYQLPGLVPAGAANTFTLGTGQVFKMGGQSISADIGLEYTMVSGSSNATPASGPVYTSGDNTVNLYAAHLGATYAF